MKNTTSLLKKFFLYSTQEDNINLENHILPPIRVGLISVVITIGIFVIWTCTAPLDNAIVAEGSIRLNNHKKEIQHYEGGVVNQILIKDGDKVIKGQNLIVLNNSKTRSEVKRLLWQLRVHYLNNKRLYKNLALLAYLKHNYNKGYNTLTIKPNSHYLDFDHHKIIMLYQQQMNMFDSYKSYILTSITSYTSKIKQIRAEIVSLSEKIISVENNCKILQEEYNRRENLFNNQLDRQDILVDIKGRLELYKGESLSLKARLAAARYELLQGKTILCNFIDKENIQNNEELKRNKIELHIFEEQYLSALDAYKRTYITAPTDGLVTALNVHTIGSSIRSNDTLLDIIPQDDSMIIESYILAKDLNNICVGSKSMLQLNAYQSKIVPRIQGKIIYISADKFDKHAMQGQSSLMPVGFYKIKIEILPEEIAKVNSNIELYLGMPVSVFIIKGERTFGQYLYSPIINSFHRSFKES